ncbi:MAG: cysteine synthase family protein [Patescibacteria group bacterium]|nr:cysteine synthase family protein [Patescibacteria group bacterium]MBU1870881.1 cysteine synthase family protein [Patescibacteria group bacterium]
MNKSILKLIGNTPLVKINKLNQNKKVELYVKLEYFNPGGSIKDRIALRMIEQAEKNKELTKNKIILEATSGNTGIGLALVAAVKGYKLLLTMSEAASLERKKILKALGAEILFTLAKDGTDGAIEKAYQLAKKDKKYWLADQFNNPENWKAHYYGTAEEIWKQTNGKITHFVAGIGTSGTLMGISKRLKEYNSKIKIIGVEPNLNHKIQGLKNMKEAYKPGIYDKTLLDEKINIKDEDAFEMSRCLTKEEGIFVGMSSGAAMFVALEKIKKIKKGLVVVLFPDSGERYLSTQLFN